MAIARDLYKPNWADTSEKNAAMDYLNKQDNQFCVDVFRYALARKWIDQIEFNKVTRYFDLSKY